jgi:ribosome modulation factor
MKNTIKGTLMAGLLGAALFSVPGARALQQGPPPPGYGPDYGHEPWASVPPDIQGAESQGFHDGIAGARKDYENHRPPSVENRDEYRHPPVHGRDRDAYRHGFRRGYQTGVDHLMHGGPHPY